MTDDMSARHWTALAIAVLFIALCAWSAWDADIHGNGGMGLLATGAFFAAVWFGGLAVVRQWFP